MANRLIHKDFIGAYVYALTVDGVFRYIGKGRRYRAIEHFRCAREVNARRTRGEKVKALPVHRRLADAMRNGAKCDYKIIANGLSDEQAYRMEAALIAGAPDQQLWNLMPGGGVPNTYLSTLWKSQDFRDRIMSTRRRTMYGNEDWREQQRRNAIAQWADPEKREYHFRQHRKLWDDPVASEERRALLKKVWSDPEKKARKSELVKSQWTPERRATMAENRRKAWADPEFKKRASISIRRSKAPK